MRSSTRPAVGILADDLTGGADAAAPFLAGGMSVTVSREPHTHLGDGADVVAYVTNSRDVALPLALERVEASLLALAELDTATVMKKIDSTLRGHLGPELALACSVLGPSLVVVAPAFPAHGRQLVDGRLVLDGRPVDSSTASLPQSLADAGIAAELVPTASVRSGTLGSLFERAREGAVFVCDAAIDEDLSLVVAAGSAADRRMLWVGSAGLAAALARRSALMKDDGVRRPRREQPRSSADGPVVLVVGSVNDRALTQARVAAANPECRVLPVDLDALFGAPDAAGAALAGYLADGRDVVLLPNGEVDPGRAADIVRGLARIVASVRDGYRGLVLTGGATAEAVLDELEIGSFALRGEIEIGVPLGYSESEDLAFVTKAGGFGDEQLLERCRGALHDELLGTRS